MAAQGERVSEAIDAIVIDVILDPMAQDKSPEQDIVMGELELPPTNGPRARNGRGRGV